MARPADANPFAPEPSGGGAFLRRCLFPWGHPYVVPSDALGHEVARLLIEPSATCDRLTAECFVPRDERESVGAIELALAAEPIETKIRTVERAGRFAAEPRANLREIARLACEHDVISPAEYETIQRRNRLRDIVVSVDDFPFDFGRAVALDRTERQAA